jgi:hypothetical protein
VAAIPGSGRPALEFSMPKASDGAMINLFFITEEPHGTFLMARFGRLSDQGQ